LSPKTIGHRLVVGEHRIFNEILEIIRIARKANAAMTCIATEDYTARSIADSIRVVTLLEKESDEIAFKVNEDITGGAVSPNILDELLEAVQHADNIVDQYHNLSRELGRMSNVGPKKNSQTSHEWSPVFASMIALAGKALSKLETLLSASDVTEMLKMRKEIEALEEQGDEIKDTGFDKLYAAAPKLNYLQFFHYSQVLHMCDNIMDECEDLSDTIVSVVSSILK
jgi:uncharacterized protein Yka (UPF0111/DUF47 family)